jgi:preprotein translocase subunit SecF
MLTKYILGALSLVFLALALMRMASGGAKGQIRTWLLIGVIFGIVSAWLFLQQGA